MRRSLLPALVGCLLATSCTGTTGTQTGAPTAPQLKTVGGLQSGVFRAADRKPAPQLSGRTLDGQQLDIASFRGQIVVVNFWASWCDPCRAEARSLNAVATRSKGLGVQFVGIDIKDDTASARAFQRNKGVPYPSLEDQPGALLLKFRGTAPQSPPTTLILDRQGRVAARFLAPVTETQLEIPVQVLAKEST